MLIRAIIKYAPVNDIRKHINSLPCMVLRNLRINRYTSTVANKNATDIAIPLKWKKNKDIIILQKC